MTGFIRVQAEGYRTEASLKTWIDRGLAAAAANPKEHKTETRKAGAPKKAGAAKRKRA